MSSIYVYTGSPYRKLKQFLPKMRRKVLSSFKIKFRCRGGVIHGHALHLSTAGTMPFTLNGQTGYYNNKMEWVEL